MSDAQADRTADRVAEEAAGWFVRLQTDTSSGDDWLAFEAWLQVEPSHQAAYARLEDLWVDLDEVPQDTAAPQRPAARRKPRRRSAARRPRIWVATGAALAASVVLAVFIVGRLEPPMRFQTYSTAAGETREIALDDGTRIRLNAASSLRVGLGRRARRVQMADAEATFDIAHDPRRPFVIEVGDRQIRDIGTEFNLRHRDGATTLTLRRGEVEVRAAGDADGEVTTVSPGQQLIHQDGAATSTLAAVEPATAFAWTAGQLIYQDAPLSEVAADLSRRFGAPIRVADPATGRVRFTGVLVTDTLAAVQRRLEAYAPVSFVRNGDGFVLQRRSGGH